MKLIDIPDTWSALSFRAFALALTLAMGVVGSIAPALAVNHGVGNSAGSHMGSVRSGSPGGAPGASVVNPASGLVRPLDDTNCPAYRKLSAHPGFYVPGC